ncbi:hypothetical protein [Bradyrhizobium japonicum]|uniref:hypothetical protein n=1 Tax=Bradyrhizobium japonicum TaxID=375 RepID=UPI0005804B3D|nr:hypothetical protein [Bradyrhizobium japonicum]MBR0914979.1 hypothetical protein [Bradyrhizobium japonicum]MCD9109006.1 hypothetical protein [Bradyrhizobium japonicum]MCD9255149.1 hypothetical protein [Bradyrhizobium japonicum SEMIA 5079]MCD9821919.1 hypothetical protein [Bradyrhizobium japonicum]MCD9893937.1 hypothetical protein [Bradyrhizobium japonicum]
MSCNSGRRFTVIVGALALFAGIPAAFGATGVSSGCVANTGVVSAERATDFLANPGGLLDQFKDGQGGLASAVRDLLTARPETVDGIASLAKASSADQSRAIGAGLGTAASVCVLSQPGVAQLIQEAVLKTENPDLIQSFTSITGDIPTEATNGADPTGETTAGGGPGSTAAEARGGAATSTQPTVVNQSGPGPASQTLFAATSTAVLTSVSPSR